MNEKILERQLRLIIPEITPSQIGGLKKFVGLVYEWNQKVNLISRKDVEHIWEHHIFPSLLPLRLLKIPEDCGLLDIGSGGGFPAIPLKIVRPDTQMVLVESIRKKALFLRKVISELSLPGIAVINERVERVKQTNNLLQQFHVVTARAVATIPQLIQWGLPFLKPSGVMLLWKGKTDIPELKKFSEPLRYDYHILTPPPEVVDEFPKLKDLRWFVIKFQEVKNK